ASSGFGSRARPESTAARTPADLGLTARQLDVLALMMRGKSNKAICRILDLAEPTVKNHVTAILKALRVTNRTEAVIMVGELGWGGCRNDDLATPLAEQPTHAFEHELIIVDNEDELAAERLENSNLRCRYLGSFDAGRR